MSDRSFCCSLQKSKCCSFFALFKRATKRAIAFSLFHKEQQKSDRSFALSKRAKEEKLAIFQIAHFSLKKKRDRSFSKWMNAQPWVGQSLICSSLISALFKRVIEHCLLIRSFKKSIWAIALFVALCKRENERSLFLALFAKEQMSNRSFLLFLNERPKEQSLFQKSYKKSDRSFTLSKRAMNLNKNLLFCSTYLPVKDSAQVMHLHTTLIFALFDNELQ